MQQRNLAAYLAELIGTLLLVFFISSVVAVFLAPGSDQFAADFTMIGLVCGFTLFGLIVMFGAASGAHLNPAVTLAAVVIRRISPVDATVYVIVQFVGAVLGALLCKALLLDEGGTTNYGAPQASGMVNGDLGAAVVEAIGTFCLVLVVLASVFSRKSLKDWAPLAIGITLGFIVMVGGPLSGGSYNPARWFGPALVSGEWGGVWPYLAGPVVGSLLAVFVFRLLEAGSRAPSEPPERLRPESA